VDIAHIEAVLAVAEELHFGQAASRLHTSQPMVSRRIAELEREIGGQLFERTSRRVTLTPLGAAFVDALRPGYEQVTKALASACSSARQADGVIRVGFTSTTEGPALTRLVKAYRAAYPRVEIDLRQVPIMDPYTDLRSGTLDVLLNWLAGGEPDLTFGPDLERQGRVLAVSASHRLARRRGVSVEDLADLNVFDTPSTFPRSLWHAVVPTKTPSGRPIPRTVMVTEISEMWAHVALGQIVHPTFTSIARQIREDIVLVPFVDLPPMPLGLIWCSAHEDSRIRSLADIARSIRKSKDERMANDKAGSSVVRRVQ
jgi:DNA-binding transcriptional LysR family regulator